MGGDAQGGGAELSRLPSGTWEAPERSVRRGRNVLYMATALALLSIVVGFVLVLPWIRMQLHGARVPVSQVAMMRLRGAPVSMLVRSFIAVHQAGLPISLEQLESHAAAGGRTEDVVHALIQAQRAGIPLDFATASAVDFATRGDQGRGIRQAVDGRISPVVLKCPPGDWRHELIVAKALDGTTLNLTISLTVRTNLTNYVGGSGSDTLAARAAEIALMAIGATQDHREVLRRPSIVSEALLGKDVTNGTMFDIASVDVNVWPAE